MQFKKNYDTAAVLEKACNLFNKYQLLVHKLTVMSSRFPKLFEKTISCTYIAIAIATKMELKYDQIHVVFFAALVKDIGLLHIDPDLVIKDGTLTPEEWKTLRSHPLITKVFLDTIGKLPKQVSRAIYEHHECTDGSGYPLGKTGDMLCMEGQIVALADTITAIYYKNVVEKGYTLAAIIPVLQVNSTLHFYEAYKAANQLLRELSPPRIRLFSNEEAIALATDMRVRSIQLEEWNLLARELTVYSIKSLPQHKTRKLEIIYDRLQDTISSSGLFTKDHVDWLNYVITSGTEEDFSEVEHTNLMQSELEWQLIQWKKALLSIIDSNEDIFLYSSWENPSEKLTALFNNKTEDITDKEMHTEKA